MLKQILHKLFGKPVDFKLLATQGAVIIDVRTPQEFIEGHLKGSLNIPLNTLQGSGAKIKQQNKPVITVCRSGARSAMAAKILKQKGIEAYNGGAWHILEQKIT